MILGLLKSNKLLNYLLLPIIAVAVWLVHFTTPATYPFFDHENQLVLYSIITHLTENKPVLQTAIALTMVLTLGLLIQRINGEYAFLRTRSLLPAPLFVILASGFPILHSLHPVYFAALFLLFALYRLFSVYDLRQAYSQAFDAGFLLGLGSLFYLNQLTLLPAMIAAVVMLGREAGGREIALTFLGALLPWIFTFAIYFVTGNFQELITTLKLNIFTDNQSLTSSYPLLLYVGFLAILTLLGSFTIIRQYGELKVNLRKYFTILFIFFISSILSLILLPSVSAEALILATIPVTFLLSNFLVSIKSKFWSELFFTLILGFVIYMQFT